MNNRELFHRWAHQVKPQGKSGNVFYEALQTALDGSRDLIRKSEGRI